VRWRMPLKVLLVLLPRFPPSKIQHNRRRYWGKYRNKKQNHCALASSEAGASW
jgi:hypothetical protein